MKPPALFSPPSLVLVLVLFLSLTADLSARPVSASQPPAAAPAAVLAAGTNRTTVVRLAGVGMILALMIMYRTKH